MGLLATLTGFRLLRFILRVVTLLVLAVVVYLLVTMVQVWLVSRRDEPRPAGAIVVMGAAQYNGVPSPDLAARLDEAELLWRQHYATDIMVTGSKQPGDVYTESEASARYLIAAGIPGRDIFEAGGATRGRTCRWPLRRCCAMGTTPSSSPPTRSTKRAAWPSPRRWDSPRPDPHPDLTDPGNFHHSLLRQGDGGCRVGPDHRLGPPERAAHPVRMRPLTTAGHFPPPTGRGAR